ncbi:MAG TPA: ZIP family metal transporter [Woeseiaceae bacterium]|nr:ZIP family metal transporter [Woeseiaceae bacterium]
MSILAWIVLAGVLMSLIAMVGSVTLLLKPATLDRLLLPLVAFAAGSLIGGALFHMLPSALAAEIPVIGAGVAIACGFAAFFALEQALDWHHCRRNPGSERRPLTWLVLIGDSLHNFIGGIAIAGAFLVDLRLGITAWLAAAAHEVPQELGDFSVLVHGGWRKRTALFANVLSASTFLIGGLLAYGLSPHVDVTWLIPFAAGNFLYIGASDLVPEVNRNTNFRSRGVSLLAFLFGLGVLLAAAVKGQVH